MLAMVACKKTDIVFGTAYVDNESTQIVKVDTFSATLSTVYVDSFATNGAGATLLGSYTDPLFGHTTSQVYFELPPPNYEDIYQYTLFDSLTLIARLNNSYYGDSAKPVQLSVYPLTTNIQLETNTASLYNITAIPQSATPLGTANMFIQPLKDDSISIRLNNTMGMQLLGMLQRKSDTITNTTLFKDYYKGFTISAGGSTDMLFGLTDTILLRLHYKKQGLFLQDKTLDIAVATTYNTFNRITTNRAGTPLAALGPTQKELPAQATGNTAYSQYFSSVMAKIQFPNVRELLKAPGYKKLLRASLIIRPVQGSYGFYALPPELRLSLTNVLNEFSGDLYATNASGTNDVQTGNVVIDYVYGKDSYYTYDVTSYINSLLTTENYPYNGLLLTPTSGLLKTTANRIALGNRYNANGKIELQLYYAIVQ
jgi:hypothetical protein